MSRSPRTVDAALSAVLVVLAAFVPDPDGRGSLIHESAWLVGIAVLGCLAVGFRRSHPIPALALAISSIAVITATTNSHSPAALAALLTLYTVALRTNRRTAAVAWAATALTLLVASAIGPHQRDQVQVVLSFLAWTGLAAVAGDAVRNRRAYVSAIEERAERAERSLDEEARRRVAEERLRIARELHDVVAHHMAVVNVQAGAASHLLATDLVGAEQALAQVRRAGRSVLDELSGILSVLRDPEDRSEGTLPAPGLTQLDELLSSLTAAGLSVELSQSGEPRELGPAVDLVAYRILQEALTNAHKHGTGSARAHLTYRDHELCLSVTNVVGARTCGAGGHGLMGMRERAAAVGGELTAQQVGPEVFRVEASLPTSSRMSR